MEDTDNLPVDDGAEPEDVETEEVETEAAPETDEDGNPTEEPDEPEDDSEEIEYDGEKYRVPRNLKDAFLRQSDYTRKTQEIADQRKELEGALERVNSAGKEEMTALTRVAGIDAQLAQYDNIDWDQWRQTNPVAAQDARLHLIELRQLRDSAVNEYNAAREQTRSVAQQETARRMEEGQKVLAKEIQGWGRDKAEAILAFGQEAYGVPRERLEAIEDPWMVVALHDAMEGRKARTQTATKKAVEAKQSIKPAAKVKGATGVGYKGLDDRLPIDEWVKRRNAQAANR